MTTSNVTLTFAFRAKGLGLTISKKQGQYLPNTLTIRCNSKAFYFFNMCIYIYSWNVLFKEIRE